MSVTMPADIQAAVVAEIVESLLVYSHELNEGIGEITRTIEMPDSDWLPITVYFADERHRLEARLVAVNPDPKVWECKYVIGFDGGR
jgi:hypothetical protein